MRTIKVQIALAVDECGGYHAHADDKWEIDESMVEAGCYVYGDTIATYIVEVEVPVPEEPAPVVVQGKVVDVDTKP